MAQFRLPLSSECSLWKRKQAEHFEGPRRIDLHLPYCLTTLILQQILSFILSFIQLHASIVCLSKQKFGFIFAINNILAVTQLQQCIRYKIDIEMVRKRKGKWKALYILRKENMIAATKSMVNNNPGLRWKITLLGGTMVHSATRGRVHQGPNLYRLWHVITYPYIRASPMSTSDRYFFNVRMLTIGRERIYG